MYSQYRVEKSFQSIANTVPARESERSLEKYNKNRFKRFLFKL